MPKRPRRFTRCLEGRMSKKQPPVPDSAAESVSNEGTVSLSDPPPPPEDTASVKDPPPPDLNLSDTRTVQDQVLSNKASRYVSNRDLKANLKRTYKELCTAQSNLISKDRQIHRLTKKNQELLDAARTNRELLRESKAATTAEVKRAKLDVKSLEDTIQQKDSIIVNQKNNYDTDMYSRVAAAVDKEKVSI